MPPCPIDAVRSFPAGEPRWGSQSDTQRKPSKRQRANFFHGASRRMGLSPVCNPNQNQKQIHRELVTVSPSRAQNVRIILICAHFVAASTREYFSSHLRLMGDRGDFSLCNRWCSVVTLFSASAMLSGSTKGTSCYLSWKPEVCA